MTDAGSEPSGYHALLVGIDAYTGVSPLSGCVNDIDAIQRVLMDRLGIPRDRITRLAAPRAGDPHESDVPEDLPTLANLRAALDRLASDAVRRGDRVLIYYSGHGTQARLVDQGRSYLREALLPVDHRHGLTRRYLYDWELNGYLSRIAQRTDAITVVLDCCCSAGATRALPGDRGGRERFAPSPDPIPITAAELPEGGLGPRGFAGNVQVCQVVAACLDDERARESGAGARVHGELTRALVELLGKLPGDELTTLRWGRIWRDLIAAVAALNPNQHPWMWGGLSRLVFGGPVVDGDPGYGVTRDGDRYHLDAGSLSGVTEGARVAVYPSTPLVLPAIDTQEERALRAGLLRVTEATRGDADAVAIGAAFQLPQGARGRLVQAGQGGALLVALAPHDDQLAATLTGAPCEGLVRLARASEAPDVTLVRRDDGGWALTDAVFGTDPAEGEPVLVVIPPSALDRTPHVLLHYRDYSMPLRLAKGCTDLPGMLRLVVLDCNRMPPMTDEEAQHPRLPEVAPGVRAPVELRARSAREPGDMICFRALNLSDVDLSVTLIDCQASGKVSILGEKRLAARAEHTFWRGEALRQRFVASLPEGIELGVDRVALLGTTRRGVSFRHLEKHRTFEDVLWPRRDGGAQQDRSRGTDGGPVPEQWTAAVTALRIAR